MGMTHVSADYFERVADQWDDLRAGYFSEAVRAVAIRKAYLRPEYHVADIGAGTGYMTAGLAPLVQHVFALDGSKEMLDIARKKMQDLKNITFQEADGLALPLPDGSLDAVFANMYLHHCPEPLAAIQEMSRLLRPGGRLVITDMDTHPYTWLRTEMADAWQGFERDQIHAWFQQAGLVNVIVDCTGEDCFAEPEHPQDLEPEQHQAHISTFVAVGTRRLPGVREAVQAGYGATAEGKSGFCSSPAEESMTSCCVSPNSEQLIPLEVIQSPQFMTGYTVESLAEAPQDAVEISLGCGNPLTLAGLQPGEVVLDIGSGGGIDAFLAARQVGPSGRVIGVDMTPAMLARARTSAEKAGFSQVEFRQGQAEALPAEDGLVDVVISNCVINLCEDKGQVFGEAFRVLKNGGRLEVSDMVTSQAFPCELAASSADWAGCVFGALPEGEYLDLIAQAGFKEIVARRSTMEQVVPGVSVYSVAVSARKSS